jgi:hypothetical protein
MICIALLGVVFSTNAQAQEEVAAGSGAARPASRTVAPLAARSRNGQRREQLHHRALQTPNTQAPTQPAPGAAHHSVAISIPSRSRQHNARRSELAGAMFTDFS